jgi:PAT family beta-lactamase induction signal transducer AmpG
VDREPAVRHRGGAGLIALTLPGPDFFRYSLAVLWLMAFSSATHDIAADGFYLLAQPAHQQAAFVGVRSTFYRLAMIAGQGGLVYLAGTLQDLTGDVARAWTWVFVVLAGFFVLTALYHLAALPRPASDGPAPRGAALPRVISRCSPPFSAKKASWVILTYLLSTGSQRPSCSSW